MPRTSPSSSDVLPVTALKGVGSSKAERLAKLGIYSVQDILFHLPLRYQDRTRIIPIRQLRVGDYVGIEAEVVRADIHLGRRRSLLVQITDASGSLHLRFFHFSAAQRASFKPGTQLRCYGEVRHGQYSPELIHPEYQIITAGNPLPIDTTLTPLYPTTEGLHQLSWRDLTDQALAHLNKHRCLQELLPADTLRQLAMPSLPEAIRFLHRPPTNAAPHTWQDQPHPAQQRLAFEEMLAHQLSLRQLRARQKQHNAPLIPLIADTLANQLRTALPFQLTQAQKTVIADVRHDMATGQPMLRLVQGDVGSGKTIVSALVALAVIEAGYQVALMAPTELLAEQHWLNFNAWLAPLKQAVGWLSGRHKGKKRQQLLTALAAGNIPLLVGTHALFQDDVQFAKLGLVIIDEQHRFGVHQRLSLRDKGGNLQPHQMVMTATPIPRTLAMTAYADLDLSIINELPPGRTPVKTVVLSDERRAQVIQRIGDNCSQGRQAYWVCTLIEESEVLQCEAAEDTAASLIAALPNLKIGLVHGRLPAVEKQQMMQDFKEAKLDVLVATTVIEVGVDVPNASLMVIENAERLGLAQLHQLRGRVGRGSQASHCVLMYRSPLSSLAQQRLGIMRSTQDGFLVAQKDLELRGPGEVLGTRQTGEVQFRIADLLRDADLIPAAQDLADELLDTQPARVAALIKRWLGEKVQYSSV
jgi:ATP-dependent DNA helicase RecG